jgi:glycyl-tRNA synthetase beta chain
VKAFVQLPEADALAAANKRIINILRKTEGVAAEVDVALLQEPAEKALFERVTAITPGVRSFVANEDYADALKALAGLRAEVDAFFDGVMVMAEEPLTRANRLALLQQLAALMNQVADISRL